MEALVAHPPVCDEIARNFIFHTVDSLPADGSGRRGSLRGLTASNGIEQTILSSAKGSAYREYNSINGWDKWKPGKPLLLSGFKMQLVNGAWQDASWPLTHHRTDQKPET